MKKSAKQYIFTKGLFFYGIPTMVLCLIIFAFILKGDFDLKAIAADIPLGAFITIFICTASAIPGIKSDVKKGKAPDMPLSKNEHPIYKKLPDSLLGQSLVIAIVGTAVFAMIPIGILTSFFPSIVLSKTTYVVVKSLYTGFYINLIIRRVTECSVGQVQGKYNTVVD